MAKWWKPEDSDIEARCYLQLSGWYNDQAEPQKIIEVKPLPKVDPIIPVAKVEPLIKTYQQSTIQLPKQEPYKVTSTTNTQVKNTSGSCYIATLCYGNYYAEEVCIFRDFRDSYLCKIYLGRKFIIQYYRFAPKLTNKLAKYPSVNLAIKRLILNPLLIIIKAFKLDK